MPQLTAEQQAVIAHPLGSHARVLAVAGAGKTTTMTHRVRALVAERNVPPGQIALLMFNRLAKQQFTDKLAALLPPNQRPHVYTFHSFAYTVLNAAIQDGDLPAIREKWFSERGEEARRLVLRLIQRMEREREVRPDSIDPEEVLAAIGLWKSALIPPERAGYRGKSALETLYLRFEEARTEAGAITFDDFVPVAVQLLAGQPHARRRWLGRYQQIIVDEYQDVNLGQQRLIELLAGDHADVMVVGDDDQTIYEWRGARPAFILSEFKTRLGAKPVQDYTLSHSFRFGPVLAQCAENSVRHNTARVSKRVIAHHADRQTTVHVDQDTSYQVNKRLADTIAAYIADGNDLGQLIVLGRLFSQMNGLELEFLTRQQPYRVEGGSPLLERNEIVKLLTYPRLAAQLDDPVTSLIREAVLATVNVPNRMLKRTDVSDALTLAQRRGDTLRTALMSLADILTSPFSADGMLRFDGYIEALTVLGDNANAPAGEALGWLIDFVGYEAHFDDYYGRSEAAEDRKRAVGALRQYAHTTGHTLTDFLAHVDSLDTTHGAPESEQVTLTSIHRVKGLEYDVVVLPDCATGYLPCLVDGDSPVYDKGDADAEPAVAYSLDAERRLFYVAITRARQHLYIGTVPHPQSSTSPAPSRFLTEMGLTLTAQTVDAYQRADWETLAAVLERADDLPGLVENMTAHYLSDAEQNTLAADIQAAWATRQQARAQVETDIQGHKHGQQSTKPQTNPTSTVYARTHEPWTRKDDTLLLRLKTEGYSTGRIAEKLQRQPSKVLARLRKLRQT